MCLYFSPSVPFPSQFLAAGTLPKLFPLLYKTCLLTCNHATLRKAVLLGFIETEVCTAAILKRMHKVVTREQAEMRFYMYFKYLTVAGVSSLPYSYSDETTPSPPPTAPSSSLRDLSCQDDSPPEQNSSLGSFLSPRMAGQAGEMSLRLCWRVGQRHCSGFGF